MRKLLCIIALTMVFIVSAQGQAQEKPQPFKDGDRVVFFGDSITHAGWCMYYLQAFYATRLPAAKIEFINAGISGAEVAGSLPRLEQDVLERKPTQVYAMFGMNDVGRQYYSTATPDEQNRATRKYQLDGFLKGNEQLLERLGKAGVPLTLISPSPYDQYAKTGSGALMTVCNDGLAGLTVVLKEFAAAKKVPLIDLHTPMTALLQKHPEFPYSRDRIHPDAAGSLIMAYEIVKAQGLTALVAKAGVDAAAGSIGAQENCTVSGFSKDAAGVSFTYAAKALPFPALTEYKAAAAITELGGMNQEIIQIAGLAEGNYALKVGDKQAGIFGNGDLAKGVNIAELDTPQQASAQSVWRAIEKKKREFDEPLRCYWMVVFGMKGKGIDMNDRAACDKHIAEVNASNDEYGKGVMAYYIKYRDILPDVLKQRQQGGGRGAEGSRGDQGRYTVD